MNREIKFRAWDKNNNKMRYVGWKPYAETVGDMLNWFEDENLMQYTGLKDKNGKEIYEGDIVKIGEAKKIRDVINFASGGFNLGYGMLQTLNPKTMEVIGNIYENPELLEEKQP